MCDRVDQLTLFPYNRGWENQAKSVGVYRAPLEGFPSLKVGGLPSPRTKELMGPPVDQSTRRVFLTQIDMKIWKKRGDSSQLC